MASVPLVFGSHTSHVTNMSSLSPAVHLLSTETFLMSTQAAGTGLMSTEAAESGLISTATTDLVVSILGSVVFPAVFVCGAVGNTLTLVTLWAAGLQDNVHFVLFCLAVADLCYLLAYYIPLLSHLVKYVDVVLSIHVRMLTIVRLQSIAFIFSRISSLFVCFIAAERLVVVVFPFQAAAILTRRRIRVTCVLIYLGALVLMFPMLLATADHAYVFSSEFNQTIPIPVLSDFYKENLDFYQVYVFLFLTIAIRICPIVVVSLITVCIVATLKKSRQWSAATSTSADSKRLAQERKITRTLVSVCVLFVVTSLPYIVYFFCAQFIEGFEEWGRYWNLIKIVSKSVTVPEMINSSANFLLYITTSDRFNATFRRVFLCRSKGRVSDQKQTSATATTTTETPVSISSSSSPARGDSPNW